MNAVAVLMRISICPVTGDAGLPERKSAGCRDDFLQRLIARALSDVLTDGRGFDYVNAVVTVAGDGEAGRCCGSGLCRAR